MNQKQYKKYLELRGKQIEFVLIHFERFTLVMEICFMEIEQQIEELLDEAETE